MGFGGLAGDPKSDRTAEAAAFVVLEVRCHDEEKMLVLGTPN
jgi:hypothetical protein